MKQRVREAAIIAAIVIAFIALAAGSLWLWALFIRWVG